MSFATRLAVNEEERVRRKVGDSFPQRDWTARLLDYLGTEPLSEARRLLFGRSKGDQLDSRMVETKVGY